MPTLGDIASFFASLTIAEILVGIAVTGSMLVLVADWRISLLALAVQYVLVTVLFTQIVQLEVAIVRLIGGGLVAAMLYISAARKRSLRTRRARAAGWRNAQDIALLFEREPFFIGFPFRLIAVVLVGVSVVAFTSEFTFPNAPLLFWLVSLWMCAIGLLLISISRDALKLGMGLLSFTSGFGVLYLSIDPSLLLYGLLVVSDLIIALAIAHLASAPVRTAARRRGEI